MRMLLDWLADAVFPLACWVCSRPLRAEAARDGALCARCRASSAPPPEPLCPHCGVPLASGHATNARATCVACRLHPPAFTSALGAAVYDPETAGSPLVTAIHAFKYRAARGLAEPLAALLVERLPTAPGALLIPVPLHPTRLRERRYNQSALLVRAMARRTGQAFALRGLVRRVPTPPQAGLSAAERRANLAAAFTVRDPRLVQGRHVVLVDDVVTTGATADACARALLAGGADRVDVRAVGRTPPPRRA